MLGVRNELPVAVQLRELSRADDVAFCDIAFGKQIVRGDRLAPRVDRQLRTDATASAGRTTRSRRSRTGTPSKAWEIWSDNGGHASIAVVTEMQMRHVMPPLQLALNHGILPRLSPDVDTNNTPDPFSLMRGAFTSQRALAFQAVRI